MTPTKRKLKVVKPLF